MWEYYYLKTVPEIYMMKAVAVTINSSDYNLSNNMTTVNNEVGCGRKQSWYNWLEELRKTMKALSQDSLCP
jgi:hypothetical protein